MQILTNSIFWIVIVVIIIIMAIIGYFAEKQNQKNKSQKKEASESNQINTPQENIPNAWDNNIVVPDKRKETIHEVPDVDDWTGLPEVDKEQKPQVTPVQAPKPSENVIPKSMPVAPSQTRATISQPPVEPLTTETLDISPQTNNENNI